MRVPRERHEHVRANEQRRGAQDGRIHPEETESVRGQTIDKRILPGGRVVTYLPIDIQLY